MILVGCLYKDYEGDTCRVVSIQGDLVNLRWIDRKNPTGKVNYVHKQLFSMSISKGEVEVPIFELQEGYE